MNTEELITLAEGMASRHRHSQMFDDLVQEAVLAGLECGEGADTDTISGKMKYAIYRYRNFSDSPTAIPTSSKAHSMRKRMMGGNPTEEDLMSPLYLALLGHTTDYEDQNLEAEGSHTKEYEYKDYIAKVKAVAKEVLTEDEHKVLSEVYYKGRTQAQVAKMVGCAGSTVNERKVNALYKLRKELGLL